MASKSHAKPLSLRPLSGPRGVARRWHGIYAATDQPRELARNATDDRRHHQGEYRRRRYRLEHPGPDLRPQASQREFVRLARHLPARHVRAAAYPSHARRVHLHVRRPPRLRARRQGLRGGPRRPHPDADEYSARHLQQVGSDGEVFLLGDADAQALRPVLGDPQHAPGWRRKVDRLATRSASMSSPIRGRSRAISSAPFPTRRACSAVRSASR